MGIGRKKRINDSDWWNNKVKQLDMEREKNGIHPLLAK